MDRGRVVAEIEKALFVQAYNGGVLHWKLEPFIPEFVRYDCDGMEFIYSLFEADSDCAVELMLQNSPGTKRLDEDVLQIAARAFGYMGVTDWSDVSCDGFLSRMLMAQSNAAKLPYLRHVEDRLVRFIETEEKPKALDQFFSALSCRSASPLLRPEQFASVVHMAANRTLQIYNRDSEVLAFRTLRAVLRRQRALLAQEGRRKDVA